MQLNGNRQFIIPIDMKKTIHVNIGGMPFSSGRGCLRRAQALSFRNRDSPGRSGRSGDDAGHRDSHRGHFQRARSPPACRWWTRRSSNGHGCDRPCPGVRRAASEHARTRTDMRPERREASGTAAAATASSAGVCGGIAEYSSLDATLLRVLMALFIVFGVGLLVYLVMWIVIPNEPRSDESNEWGRK